MQIPVALSDGGMKFSAPLEFNAIKRNLLRARIARDLGPFRFCLRPVQQIAVPMYKYFGYMLYFSTSFVLSQNNTLTRTYPTLPNQPYQTPLNPT